MFLARRREQWRLTHHEAELREAARRLKESEHERTWLARDLHDTVGTTLSLVALYGALAQRPTEDPGYARKLAGTIRQAARHALDDLRAVISAIPQGPSPSRRWQQGWT